MIFLPSCSVEELATGNEMEIYFFDCFGNYGREIQVGHFIKKKLVILLSNYS